MIWFGWLMKWKMKYMINWSILDIINFQAFRVTFMTEINSLLRLKEIQKSKAVFLNAIDFWRKIWLLTKNVVIHNSSKYGDCNNIWTIIQFFAFQSVTVGSHSKQLIQIQLPSKLQFRGEKLHVGRFS